MDGNGNGAPNLADEIIKWVQENRAVINRASYGYLYVKIHQNRAASLGLYQETRRTTMVPILNGEIQRPE